MYLSCPDPSGVPKAVCASRTDNASCCWDFFFVFFLLFLFFREQCGALLNFRRGPNKAVFLAEPSWGTMVMCEGRQIGGLNLMESSWRKGMREPLDLGFVYEIHTWKLARYIVLGDWILVSRGRTVFIQNLWGLWVDSAKILNKLERNY